MLAEEKDNMENFATTFTHLDPWPRPAACSGRLADLGRGSCRATCRIAELQKIAENYGKLQKVAENCGNRRA